MLYYHIFLMRGGYSYFLRYRRIHRLWSQNPPPPPTVSILIPAHNEELVIEDTLQAMVQLHYPKDKLEVILINDCSTDKTGQIADAYAKRYPFIQVVHTQPPFGGKGKSAALNHGFRRSTGDIIVVYDADNTPEPDAVSNLVLALLKDKKAGVVVGKFRVINARKNWLTRFINVETITFQWLAQAGRWFWFRMVTIPGTNFAIRRSVLEQVGGWDEQALAEDTELSIRVYHAGYHIRFFPAAVTWEQEPETWKVWWKQRTRWVRGNLYVIGKYLFRFRQLHNKKVLLDLFYFLCTYILLFGGILTSHAMLLASLFGLVQIKMGLVSYVLLSLGFLLYMTQSLLALSLENQLTVKNGMAAFLMYCMYTQMWVALVAVSVCLETKRLFLRQDMKWYKTERFDREVHRS